MILHKHFKRIFKNGNIKMLEKKIYSDNTSFANKPAVCRWAPQFCHPQNGDSAYLIRLLWTLS